MAKILLVEDDNNLREIYEARLQAEGYEIVAARDGEEALVVAKNEHPDLIISDVMMPKISGFEMLDILRSTENMRDVKVIMLTALGQAEDQQQADRLGADRYLVKSQVTLEDIVRVSQDLLNESSPDNQLQPAPALESISVVPAPEAVAQAPEPSAPVAVVPEPVMESVSPAVSIPAVIPEPIIEPPVATPIPSPVQSAPVIAEPLPVVPEPTPETTVEIPTPPPAVEPLPVSVPETIAPVPTQLIEPSVTPETIAEPAVDPLASMPVQAPTSGDSDQPQSSAEEAQAIEQQIAAFVQQQSVPSDSVSDPTPAPEAYTAPEVIAPESTPRQEETPPTPTTTPEQEQALNDALTNLGGGEPLVQPPAAPAEPTPPVTTPVHEDLTPTGEHHGRILQPLFWIALARSDVTIMLLTVTGAVLPLISKMICAPPSFATGSTIFESCCASALVIAASVLLLDPWTVKNLMRSFTFDKNAASTSK